MNKIFGYDFRDIPYINRLKNRIFIGVVIIVLLLNLFVSLTLNFKKVADESLFNPFIIVDIQHNLKEEEKNKIETYILSLAGVSAVRFMDKTESFALLQNDLNISIPESTNPLFDSMIVYLKDIELAEKIQENLEAKKEIKEVYKENDFFEREMERGLVFSIIQISSAIVAFLLSIISIILFNLNIGIEFLNSVNVSRDFQTTIRSSKIRNLLSFSSSTIIGTLIFFNIYVYFRKYIFHNYFQYTILSLWQTFIFHVIVIVFLNFIVWILPANIFKIDGGKK